MSDSIYPQKHIISKFRKKLYNSELRLKNQFGPKLTKKKRLARFMTPENLELLLII